MGGISESAGENKNQNAEGCNNVYKEQSAGVEHGDTAGFVVILFKCRL